MAIFSPLIKGGANPARESLLWPPLNIGHRGASGEAPENTLPAFELALRQGADGIEFDVHLSADGVPMVIHDPRLERTTTGRGPVSRLSVTALRRLDAGSWFNRSHPSLARARYVGSKIPTLAEVLVWVKKRGCLAFVEIKRGATPYPEIEAKVLAEIYRAGTAPKTTVISFHVPTLRRLRRMDSTLSLGIDFTRPLLAILRGKRLRASALVPHWAFASRRFLRRAHRAALHVLVWDLDQPRWMERKIADGVDGIITGFPARLAEILARLEPAR